MYRLCLRYSLAACQLKKNQIFSKKCINSYSSFQLKKEEKIGNFAWFLLLIPLSTFALGTWQINRKKWKENLIKQLESRTTESPKELPLNLEINRLKELEYLPFYVQGNFLHERELFLGPRSLISNNDSNNNARNSLFSTKQKEKIGYLVITPFKLKDRNEIILINRGWVSVQNKNPLKRKKGQIQEETELVGLLRLQENRPNFSPKNNPQENNWYYKDLNEMCLKSGATIPIMLDAISDYDIGGECPKGGQTNVSLRNEHLSYVFTWYGICLFTSIMWYRRFLLKLPLL